MNARTMADLQKLSDAELTAEHDRLIKARGGGAARLAVELAGEGPAGANPSVGAVVISGSRQGRL